ncbi:hypothetical protein QQF64_020416 [Cirrhinus molitorella]|uniref:Integrase zinc-binding domain-containing protein n=1 Tax=Cirrhinus molitorella TaxID=172907 RepID=A0ABR3L936_9TELE
MVKSHHRETRQLPSGRGRGLGAWCSHSKYGICAACVQSLGDVEQNESRSLTHEELLEKQSQDPVIDRVKFFVERGRRPSCREKVYESKRTLKILQQWGKLALRLGILYRISKNPVSKKKTYQFVVPTALRSTVLKGVHDNAGHQGQHRTLWLARQRNVEKEN